jgi:hypothetical protein
MWRARPLCSLELVAAGRCQRALECCHSAMSMDTHGGAAGTTKRRRGEIADFISVLLNRHSLRLMCPVPTLARQAR